MNIREYERKQLKASDAMLCGPQPKTQIEKDIWELKYMITEIRPYSRPWRRGRIRALRRAIAALEKEKDAKSAP